MLITHLEVRGGERVDIREDAWEERDFRQEAPLLIGRDILVIGHVGRLRATRGAVGAVGLRNRGDGEVEDMQCRFVRGDGEDA